MRSLRWRVSDVRMIDVDDGRRATPSRAGVASVETDDFSALSGGYEGLPRLPHIGLTQAAVEAYATAALRAAGVGRDEVDWVYVDVVGTGDGTASDTSAPTCATLDAAVERRWLEPRSAAAKAVARYGLDHVHAVGENVIGPRHGFVEVVARAVDDFRPKRVVDLAAGTLTGAVVALEHGAGSVVALDRHFCPTARALAGRYGSRLRLVESDYRTLEPLPGTGLVVADFYYHDLPGIVTDGWFRAFLQDPAALVLPIGLSYERGWISQILELLSAHAVGGRLVELGGESFFVKPPHGLEDRG